MNIEEMKESIKIVKEKHSIVKELQEEIDNRQEVIEKHLTHVNENPVLKHVHDSMQQYSIVTQTNEVLKLFDQVLTKLISKRQTIKCSDGMEIIFGNSGFAGGRKTSYYSRYNDNPKYWYLPTSRNDEEKFKKYLKILQHYVKIRNRLHKKDKKEIMTICGTYATKFLQLESRYENLNKEKNIIHITPTEVDVISDEGRWRTPRYKITPMLIDHLFISNSRDGIYLSARNENYESRAITISHFMGSSNKFFLFSITQNEEIKDKIYKAIEEYGNETKEFVTLVDELKRKLMPYTLMDLFGE